MINWDKPIETKDGRKARLLGRLVGTDQPMVVAVMNPIGGRESLESYSECGFYLDGISQTNWDLRNVPVKHDRWVNEYPDGSGRGHSTREAADQYARANRIACVHYTFTDGEGLEGK